MTILAALLLIGASGSARAEMEVPEKRIPEIIANVAWGAASDVGSRIRRDGGTDYQSLLRAAEELDPQLTIDGRPREGIRAWGEAAWQTAGYAFDLRSDGSVEYSYRLRIQRYDIRRETRITDGQVRLITTADWVETVQVTRRIQRRIPVHVTITIHATEHVNGTRLAGVATGYADTSDFRCRLVRRIAEREAAETLGREMPVVLRTIRTQGTEWYRTGAADIGTVLDRIGSGVRAGVQGIRILRR